MRLGTHTAVAYTMHTNARTHTHSPPMMVLIREACPGQSTRVICSDWYCDPGGTGWEERGRREVVSGCALHQPPHPKCTTHFGAAGVGEQRRMRNLQDIWSKTHSEHIHQCVWTCACSSDPASISLCSRSDVEHFT